VIPNDFITEWRNNAPWPSDAQVEQDLIITRVVVEIFRDSRLASQLAWRGGTALHKLYLRPPQRYSEDIDLVQVKPEAIGPTLDRLKMLLDPWLGNSKRVFKEGRVNLVYRLSSEGPLVMPLRLKIEINTREHFSADGYRSLPIEVVSRWFYGAADVTTFTIEELLGTKLRALYQRKKGRDLFDLWYALSHHDVDTERVVLCFLRYLDESDHRVSQAVFEQNLIEKIHDRRFETDVRPLLRPNTGWDLQAASTLVLDRLVSILPGNPWKGRDSRPRSPQ